MEPTAARTASEPKSAASIAASLTALRNLGVRDRSLFSAILHSVLEANPGILGVWSVWEPNALDARDHVFRNAPGHDQSGRFVPYWHRGDGAPKLDPVTDYEKPGTGYWYWIPKKHRQLCATEAYDYPVGRHRRWITSEIAPILEEGRCVGVVGIDHLAESQLPLDPAAARNSDKSVPSVHVLGEGSDKLSLLTNREREVHYWLSQGKSNEEIGIILGISAHTVKNHLERIFQKLGVENRYAAALTQ